MAAALGIRPAEVFWTTSGPTAVGVAVQGLLERPGASRRAVVTAVESMAVTSPAGRWAEVVDRVRVHPDGRVRLDALAEALRSPAGVVCVQAANPEVGTRQPLAAAHELATAAGVPLLVHAVQVLGRGPVPQHWDVLAASARDWGGPAGVGLLAVREHVRWVPEENPDRGWVVGFPDVAGAAAAASAMEYLAPAVAAEAERASELVRRIRSTLPAVADGITVAGPDEDRLPHIVTFTCTGVVGEVLVDELARRGLSVASGSACTSDTRMPSQVLLAMGLASDASVRVSLPLGCTPDTVESFLAALPEALATVRA